MRLTYNNISAKKSLFSKYHFKSPFKANYGNPSYAFGRSLGAFVPFHRPLTYGSVTLPHPTDWAVFQCPLVYRGATHSPQALAHCKDSNSRCLSC